MVQANTPRPRMEDLMQQRDQLLGMLDVINKVAERRLNPGAEDAEDEARRAASLRRFHEWKITDQHVWEQAEFNLRCFQGSHFNRLAVRRRLVREEGNRDAVRKVQEEERMEAEQCLLVREVVRKDIVPLMKVDQFKLKIKRRAAKRKREDEQ